jgi:Carboxypeptidase regulatory-like domain/TonB dependent receptor
MTLAKNSLRIFCAFLVTVLCCTCPVMGQSATATVSGQITDASGATVPGAEVQLKSVERGIITTTTTNDAGIYLFANVEPGQYQLTVRKAGFKQTDLLGLIANVQDHIEQNFRLQVGSSTVSVTVTADRNNINTSDATVGTTVDRQFVGNIPLNGRTLQSLIALTPGVQLTAAGFGDEGQFTVNGQRTDANYFSVDGVSANVGIDPSAFVSQTGGSVPGLSALGTTNTLVSLDDIQEFRIQTSTFAPEFGRTPGAQVSIVTRSGTNAFHGNLFEYFRNDVLDANNWFNTSVIPNVRKPAERQNDFGGTLGGPIWKDRTFFFFSYEGLRLRQPISYVNVLVPDNVSRTSAPADLQPFLNAFPIPNGIPTPFDMSVGVAPVNSSVSNPSTLNSTSLRIDHALTKTFTIFARYSYAPSSVTSFGALATSLNIGEPFNEMSSAQVRTQTLTAGATKVFGALASNEFTFNYSRVNTLSFEQITNAGGAVVPTPAQLFPSSEGLTVPEAIEGMGFAEGITDQSLFTGSDAKNVQRQVNLVDNFSLNRGTHKLRFGVDYRRISPLTRPDPYSQFLFFCGLLANSATENACFTSSSLGSVVSGVASQEETASVTPVSLVFNNYSLYAQDTWRVNPRLTLTYGLRWEINPAPTAQGDNPLVSFVNPFNVNNLQLAPLGTPFYKTTWDNFAPRLGIAYQMRQQQGKETVVRAGVGIFYDLGSNQAGAAATSFPFARENLTLGAPFPLSPALAAPIPFSLNPGSDSIATSDPNLKLPRTYQWNLAVQQALGSSQSFTATYIGAAGHDLMRNVLLLSQFGSFDTIFTNGATSSYNALQLQFQRRLSQGLQALASYTWSHSIDDQSFNTGANSSLAFNPNLERGSSDFDVRHSFSGAVTYDVPKAAALGWVGKIFLNDWAVDGIAVAHTGTPINLEVGTGTPVAGGFYIERPDVVPGQPFYLSGSACANTAISNGAPCPGGKGLNPAAFEPPPQDPVTQQFLRQGDLGRNALRALGAWQIDSALHRQFNLTEKLNLQFRAEFFNIFNHPNFAPFNPIIASPVFGISTNTLANGLSANGGVSQLYQFGGPRSIQFALRLTF